MSVEFRSDSRFWYGRWQRNNRRFCKRLKVQVAGKPGSDEFEASRQKAEELLEEIIAETDRAQRPEELVQRIHEVKFGKRVGSIRLADLADIWLALPRKRKITKGRVTYTRTVIKSFTDFVRDHHPKVQEMAGVTPEIAEAFMVTQEQRGISGRTYNAILSLLRGAFEKLREQAGMLSNPFKRNLVMKDEQSIPRKPFTVEELSRLFDAAQSDREIHALIVTGTCTALRRGDACCLKWEDVNLATNRIRVQTRKTGEKVSIPILPKLREVLQSRQRNASPYVFPTLASAYLHEPSGLNKRLNAAFARAGLRGDSAAQPHEPHVIDMPGEGDFRARVMERLKSLTDADASAKIRGMMIQVFDLYSSGMTLPDIAKDLGISKGSASNYLARIEHFAGHPIIRSEVKAAREGRVLGAKKDTEESDERDAESKQGLIKVNSRGFHAFRATFTTQALAAGVPVEVVKLITGHSVTETVLKHYFNPDERTVFKAVENAMPALLTGGNVRTESQTDRITDQMLAILDAAKPKSAMSAIAAVRSLVQELKKAETQAA